MSEWSLPMSLPQKPVQMVWIRMRPTAVSVELNSWRIVPAQNRTTLGPGHCGAWALAGRTEAPLFGRGMLTGNIMHSHDNQPVNTCPSHGLAFSPLHTGHIFTQIMGKTHTHQSTVCPHQHTQTHMHPQSQTPQCLMQTARSLVSSPRRPALNGRLAETGWHLAFRTPQSFQAEYTGLFNDEREGGETVTWTHAETKDKRGELKFTLKSRMIWRRERETEGKTRVQRAG